MNLSGIFIIKVLIGYIFDSGLLHAKVFQNKTCYKYCSSMIILIKIHPVVEGEYV